MPKFTVDTHLFRELGELLVGRDSTALVELIKNAYDADATEVIVYGEALDDKERGFIKITDNGVGMTSQEFEKGFLRIASRAKEAGARLSSKFKRHYTGAKGIGRLAAHKLASLLEIYSVSNQIASGKREMIQAKIDWNLIESKETLDDLDKSDAGNNSLPIQLHNDFISKRVKPGTEILLKQLRKKWTETERTNFLREVQTFEPPSVLTSPLGQKIISKPLLFAKPLVRDTKKPQAGFSIKFEGEFDRGDDYWEVLASLEGWAIEIDALSTKGKIKYAIAPNRKTLEKYPDAETQHFVVDHPTPKQGPFFQARILAREGQAGADPVKKWIQRISGVRVYMEGFRVLPYGELKNDWLDLNFDYARRGREVSLPDLYKNSVSNFASDKKDKNLGLTGLAQRNYFGGVFLTQKNAASLKMLVNREGFASNEAFDVLVQTVRLGIDFHTRVRAAVTLNKRTTKKPASENELKSLAEQAKLLANEARQLVAVGKFAGVEEKVTSISSTLDRLIQSATKLIAEGSMLRVLASVGTEMSAFAHEINGLLGLTEVIDTALTRLRKELSVSSKIRKELADLHSKVGDLRRSLERQSIYLVDVVKMDARRRKVRLSFTDRFNAATRLIERMAQKRGIEIINKIPSELKSTPMFSAELTAVFSNLLTNAVKAAGPQGKILATVSQDNDGIVRVRVENTGAVVNLLESERWFNPFESTTTNVDPILGQGMGLGLPITRRILEERGAEIKFVSPSKSYATAIELIFRQ